MCTDVVSTDGSYKSSSITLNNDDNHHGSIASVRSHSPNSVRGGSNIHNNNKNTNHFRDSDVKTLNDMYCEPKDDQEIKENGGIYPWLVVCGTFLVLIVGLGASSGWGKLCIMQNYFEQDETLQGTSNLSLQLSFVGTIFNVFINLLGPLGQILLSLLQPRTVLFTSITICSIGLLLASFSKQVWQLYLTQGVIYGIGSSIMFYIALTVVPLWFVKHRGMALGIISSGISIGGLVMPQIMEPLNTNLGAAWCYRIMSLVCFVVGIFSCMLFRNKAPIDSYQDPEKKSSNKLIFKEMFDFSIVKNWRFLLWVFIDILLEGGYNVPYFFLPSYATFLGLSTSQGAIILSTSSGMNAFGRIVSGIIADYVGHVNIVIIYTIISGFSCLFLWVYANTFETLMAFAIVFGFFGGTFITLTPTITLLVTGQEKFESGISVFLILTVVSFFGPNLASAIESNSPASKEYDSYKYFTGTCYIVSAVLLLFFKLSLNQKPLAKI